MVNFRPYAKKLWCAAQDALVQFNPAPTGTGAPPRVYYGGAKAGYSGGPQVKVGLLKARFPETRYGFNLVYQSSGALYLSPRSYKTLQARGIPLVVNQNGVFFPAWYPEGWQKQNERMALALESASHVFFQSAFCCEAVERFIGVQPRSSEILYNAVDTKVFSPASFKQEKDGPLRLLLTGNVGPTQSQRLLSVIEGFTLARRDGLNISLDVYGTICEDARVRAAAILNRFSLDKHVFFHGPYDRQQAPGVYRAADIYVTNKFNDNCPNAVLEALASGLPVLYSASGGVPELVGDAAGVGLFVPTSFDQEHYPAAQQFAENLSVVIQNRQAMASAARQRACDLFDVEQWLARHQAVFARCLEAGQ